MILGFLWYVKNGKVKKGLKNPARARALVKMALGRLNRISERRDVYDLEDVYESLKEVIQAFMEAEGYHPYSHEAIIAFARDFLKLKADEVAKLDKMRRIRHDSLYRGAMINPELCRELVDFGMEMIAKLAGKFEKELEKG